MSGKPKQKKRSVKHRLPNEIIPIRNEDKLFHERWKPGRNALNIPHPMRCALLGRPNSGKATVMKNIILRCKPAMSGKPKQKKRRVKHRLPNEIIPIRNEDKLFHERWKPGRNALNIPHPMRCVLLGRPNSGKTTVMKNIILRCKPAYEEIWVVHCDSSDTKEFNDMDVEMMDTIPSPEDIEPGVKRLIILEDLEYNQMPKDQKRALDRLFGYTSTHKGCSVMLTAQDPYAVPAICRRCANLWVIWKMDDTQALQTLGRRVGMSSKDFEHIFEKHCPGKKDSLWLDLTDGSPFPLRINGFQMLQRAGE